MYLCKKLTKHSYPEIGRAFGGKHHTTVIHSFEKIQSLSAVDSGLQRLLLDLSEESAEVSLSISTRISELGFRDRCEIRG